MRMIAASAYGELKNFSGTANYLLAQRVSKYLDHPLEELEIKRHPDGEIYGRYLSSIRGMDVFIFQPTNAPAENLLELLILIDAAKLASARRITAVIPYFGYARQDRKAKPRESLTARLMADLLVTAGADRVLLVDLHASQVQGFFSKPIITDHLYTKPVLAKYLDNYFNQYLGLSPLRDNLVVMAPDVSAAKVNRSYAEKFGDVPLAIVNKRRRSSEEIEIYEIIGDVEDKTVVIIDDLISTAGTLIGAAREAIKRGAKEVYAAASHGVFCGGAIARLEESPIKKIFVTDSINNPLARRSPKIKVVSIASIIGESIKRIHFDSSVSSQFD